MSLILFLYSFGTYGRADIGKTWCPTLYCICEQVSTT